MSERQDTDPGLLLYRISQLENRQADQHRRLGEAINVQIATVGTDGKNGKLGDIAREQAAMRTAISHLDTRLTKAELLGWKIAAAAGVGGIASGVITAIIIRAVTAF